MKMFWFLWPRFCQAYDIDFQFSLGHKRSYGYDSDYNTSEKQP